MMKRDLAISSTKKGEEACLTENFIGLLQILNGEIASCAPGLSKESSSSKSACRFSILEMRSRGKGARDNLGIPTREDSPIADRRRKSMHGSRKDEEKAGTRERVSVKTEVVTTPNPSKPITVDEMNGSSKREEETGC